MNETLAHAQRNVALSQRLALLEESYEQVTTRARRARKASRILCDLRQPCTRCVSLRRCPAPTRRRDDAGHIESALSYMEQLVAGDWRR